MLEKEPVAAWVVEDTGFVRKRTHSVGVARQYCGQVGKQENCRVAVSLSVTTKTVSLPVAWRQYLPESSAQDAARREQAGVRKEVRFETKPAIALKQIGEAVEEGIPTAPVLGDAGYGNDTQFREDVTALGLLYVLGVSSSTMVWKPGEGPLPKKAWRCRGQPPKRLRRDVQHRPDSVLALTHGLPESAWKSITWRPGTKGRLRSQFAAVRVRPAHRDEKRPEPPPEEWLLIEWPKGEAEPAKYWLSTLPAATKLRDLVFLAKLRWIIERDYEELKQELGLGHFERRGWRGFHHYETLCIAAYGLLVAERSRFPPPPDPVNWNYPCPKPHRISGRGVLPVRTALSVVDCNIAHDNRANSTAPA